MPLATQFSAETYEELRKVAAYMFQKEEPCTLQPTALVHEALMRIHASTKSDPRMADRRYFFASAAEAMRRILIEHARKRNAEKFGGCFVRVPLEQVDVQRDSVVIFNDLNEALEALEQQDKEAAELVRLRFFVGMTMQQAAEAMNLPLRSTERIWTYAKTWLYEKLSRTNKISGGSNQSISQC
jgi:RNA polymerase sigma factor (TIGR02999 family)